MKKKMLWIVMMLAVVVGAAALVACSDDDIDAICVYKCILVEGSSTSYATQCDPNIDSVTDCEDEAEEVCTEKGMVVDQLEFVEDCADCESDCVPDWVDLD